MMLVVGLGNPGAGYAGNRHNIGFMAVDALVRRHGFGPFRVRHQGLLADGIIGGEKVLALKPQTYMNDSGRSVREAAHFHKIPVENVLVIHDELDLAPCKVRVKIGGGAAGHNGLRSIDAHLGNGFKRVRLGIGHPGDRGLVTNYVLQDFTKVDSEWLPLLLDAMAEAFPLLIKGDDAGFMSRIAFLIRSTDLATK